MMDECAVDMIEWERRRFDAMTLLFECLWCSNYKKVA